MTAGHPPLPAAAMRIDEQDPILSRTRRRVLVMALGLVIVAAAVLSYRTTELFEADLAPEVLGKSDTIAESLAADTVRALDFGIPLDRLVGVTDYFDEKRAGHPEIQFIALLGADGRPLHSSGTYLTGDDAAAIETAARQLVAGPAEGGGGIDPHEFYVVMQPVRTDSGIVAVVAIGTSPQFVHRQLQELGYDVAVILLVSLFLAFEIAVALLAASTVGPLNQLLGSMRAAGAGDLRRRIVHRGRSEIAHAIDRYNDVVKALNDRYGRLARRLTDGAAPDLRGRLQRIGERFGLSEASVVDSKAPPSSIDVRLPLFIFIMAEELQKSFLPLYVRSLEGSVSWLSQEILIGLPISIYMLTLAQATPFAGAWVDRYGTRPIFLLGLVPAIVGFLGSALASTIAELILFRAMTAAGYAMCTIAAQGFIVQVTTANERARGVSIFVGVLMAASICGTAIGGILADRIGFRAVFVCAAALALLAGVLGYRMLSPGVAVLARTGFRRSPLRDLLLMLANWRFVILFIFAAIPGKIVLTGFLFYAVPLYLASLNTGEAEIGRIMMSYSLVIVFLGPWFSKLDDERGYGWWLLVFGTLLSGLAMGFIWLWDGVYGVLAAVLVVAVGHAASISPQIALLPDICRHEIEQIGETTVLGILRMLERVGSIVGPLIVAGLVAQLGFVNGLVVLGALLAVLSPMLLIAFVRNPRS